MKQPIQNMEDKAGAIKWLGSLITEIQSGKLIPISFGISNPAREIPPCSDDVFRAFEPTNDIYFNMHLHRKTQIQTKETP